MPLLDIQRRGQQIGRVRIGELIDTGKVKNGKPVMRPARLAAFRLTTGSLHSAQAVAAALGGEVRQWNRNQYEVYTDRDALMVTIPPRDEVISQWYEMWSKGGCQRRCDSKTEQLSGKPCLCPPDPIERDRLARLQVPQACKVVTRLNFMIPDLPGLGVWRLDSSSYYAAVEMGDSAELMLRAREAGVFLPAVLRIDQRERVAGGQTKKFPVITLEVLATFRQIATGAISQGGMAAQLPPMMRPAKAIEAAPAPAVEAPKAKPERRVQVSAQDIADKARAATTPAQIEELAALAKDEELRDDLIRANPDDDAVEELREYLAHLWRTLSAAAKDGAA